MAEVRILYIATADGLVQLANPGKSDRWREIGRALDGQNVQAIAASPSDPLLAFAGGTAGIERTENGGASWERVVEHAATALAFDEAGRILAAAEQGALLSSADGRAWHELVQVGTPLVQLVALPGPKLLAVGADGGVGEFDGASWRWRRVGVSDALGVAASNEFSDGLLVVGASSLTTPQGTIDLPSPATGALLKLRGMPPALLVATRQALLRSEDNGATLAPVEGPRNVAALVSPQRAVDQIFAGTSSGELWYSADRGRSWANVASGYPAVHSLAFARAL